MSPQLAAALLGQEERRRRFQRPDLDQSERLFRLRRHFPLASEWPGRTRLGGDADPPARRRGHQRGAENIPGGDQSERI